MKNEETVTISKKFYEALLEDADILGRLEAYGVDNWSGYYEALADSEGYWEDEEDEDED